MLFSLRDRLSFGFIERLHDTIMKSMFEEMLPFS